MKLNSLLSSFSLTLAVLPSLSSAGSLDSLGHIHNLTFAGDEQQTLLLGAHHGLFSYQHNNANRVSQQPFDVMGLTREPVSGVVFASGHPSHGGNTGLLRSDDDGKSFALVSEGLDGPVDFHQLA
ncbi:MAG: hypothetical protein V7752_13695, partial [Halopseudomonas sp.]